MQTPIGILCKDDTWGFRVKWYSVGMAWNSQNTNLYQGTKVITNFKKRKRENTIIETCNDELVS
jgi:hypothetical protein